MLPGLSGPFGRPPQVLMTADAVGGVWTYALDLAEGLSNLGVKTTLVVAGPAPSPAQRESAGALPGLSVIEVDAPLDWTAKDRQALERGGRVLADVAASIRPDIVHLNSPALAACAEFRAPVLGVCHSCLGTWWRAVKGDAPPADFRWRIDATAAGYAACDALAAPSRSFADATAGFYRIATPSVIYNGRRPEPPARRERERLVLTAGRLWDEGKNVRTLDRAAARIGAPVVALGPVRAPDGSAVRFDGLDTVGSLEASEVAAWMGRAQVFASAAIYEPFGLAVLEAAQAGLPLVLSDIPSFRELWGDAAVFVRAEDAAGFAAAINDLLEAPSRRRRLAEAAQRRAQRYGIAAMSKAYLRLYARLGPRLFSPSGVLESSGAGA